MSSSENPPGSIVWTDLSVENAAEVKDFYRAVAGWKPRPVDMGGYDDFNMTLPAGGGSVAGICHSRGANADLPHQWLIYIVVDDLDASMKECWAQGGRVITGPKPIGPGEQFCVIRDPSGAVAALMERGRRT